MAEELIKTILYELILNMPFDRYIRKEMMHLSADCFPVQLRDLVQMYQNMNPDLESDVRAEMKAALADHHSSKE